MSEAGEARDEPAQQARPTGDMNEPERREEQDAMPPGSMEDLA